MGLCEALFTAMLVIVTGLLFIDLVPLQETMVCDNYTDLVKCPEGFFSSNYQAAREKFVVAATEAGATVERHSVLTEGSVEYFVDTAFIPGGQPEKLLVHVSGTHGVEGYAGSAIQTKLLREKNASLLLGPSVLFIHALNPYGMAHFRRFNEHNVDLNRNYMSSEQWETARNRDPNVGGYENLRSLLSPETAPRLIDRYAIFFKGAQALWKHGFSSLKRTFVTGQYHDPKGIYYGGASEEQSIALLRNILSRHAHAAQEAVFIDVHTGLGPFGVDTIMVSSPEEEERAREVFKGTRVQNDKTAKNGPSGGYDLAMGLIRPYPELPPKSIAVTEEFGTVLPIFVARSIILENAAYQHAPGSYVHEVMAQWVRDAFYPQEMRFKSAVLSRGAKTFWNAFRYLQGPEEVESLNEPASL